MSITQHLSKLRALFGRRQRIDREIDEEIQAHLAMEIDANLAAGMSPQEGRHAALKSFGNPLLSRERARQTWTFPSAESFFQDIRSGLRIMRKNPGFTAIAVLTLALGIGANTAIFSVVNSVLLHPLPYPNPNELVMVWEQLHNLGLSRFAAPQADYLDYQKENRVFEDIAAVEFAPLEFTSDGAPERVSGIRVSANFFWLLGVTPLGGRLFSASDNQPGRDNVALLCHALWQRRFGGDLSVIGRSIVLSGRLYTVVGILPPAFRFSIGGSRLPDIVIPLALQADPQRSIGRLQLIARLKPGVSLTRADANMKAIAAGLEQQYHLYRGPHGEDAGYDVDVTPLREEITGDVRPGLLLMLAAVALVLLIVCTNVANLLLARAAARQKEIAVRSALGAGRLRLARQLLTEGAMMALMGGAVGLGLAFWGVHLLVTWSPFEIVRVLNVGINTSVLAFTLLASLATGILFATIPAVQVSKTDLIGSLREGSQSWSLLPHHHRFRQALVIVEMAFSLLLLMGAGLLIRSLVLIEKINPGFRPEGVVTAQISLPRAEYPENHQVNSFFRHALERVETLPGVSSAGLVSSLPLSGAFSRDPFSIEGRPWREWGAHNTPQVANYQVISPHYFKTLQIPVLEGRDFGSNDTAESPPVAVINKTLARGFFVNEDPIGKHIMMGAPRPGAPWLTIVGVAGDVRNSGLNESPIPQIYVPVPQNPPRTLSLVVQTAIPPMTVGAGIQGVVAEVDKNRPVYGIASLNQLLLDSIGSRRYNTLLLGLFAAAALLLAAVGIYGVISYSVARRSHEIGIRIALGAQQGDVLRLVVGQGALLALLGLLIGLAGVLALTRFLATMLYGVRPMDLITLVAVSLVLIAVALLASYIPARRAMKIDPLVALRCE